MRYTLFILFLTSLAILVLYTGCLTIQNKIKVTCGETVLTCRSFNRSEHLGHYTCWKIGGDYIDIPLSIGDTCKVEDL